LDVSMGLPVKFLRPFPEKPLFPPHFSQCSNHCFTIVPPKLQTLFPSEFFLENSSVFHHFSPFSR
jgi:hypothetical protein